MFPPVSASGLSRKRRSIDIGQSIANQLNICPAINMYQSITKCRPPPAAALAGSRLQRSAAEPELVSVGITVRGLAHAVVVGFPLHGVESPVGYLRDERIEVIDEDRVHGVAGVLRLLHNEHKPMRG